MAADLDTFEGIDVARDRRQANDRIYAKNSGVSGGNLIDDGEEMMATMPDGSVMLSAAAMSDYTPTTMGSFGDASGNSL